MEGNNKIPEYIPSVRPTVPTTGWLKTTVAILSYDSLRSVWLLNSLWDSLRPAAMATVKYIKYKM